MVSGCAGPQLRCSKISYLHDRLSSCVEHRARTVENFQFSNLSKTPTLGNLGMRRVCTRMYGAISISMAILTC
jgi:hypothetical protein